MRQSVSTIVIAGLAVVGSLAFACATPFAAITAFAAGSTGRSLGLRLVALAWLSNQMIGFAILGYPMTADSFAWGGAIGGAAILAFLASRTALAFAGRGPFGQVSGFLVSFVVFELTLYAFGLLLGTSSDAFSLATVERIFAINLGAFIGTLILDRLPAAVSSGLTAKAFPNAG